jgi:hypothetical protein
MGYSATYNKTSMFSNLRCDDRGLGIKWYIILIGLIMRKYGPIYFL